MSASLGFGMLQVMESAERVVGIDFGGPGAAGRQRKKIIAVAATRIDEHHYWVPATGFNDRLFDRDSGPGWTAAELARELGRNLVSVVAPDFPFSIPIELLSSLSFAEEIGMTAPIDTWERFLGVVRSRLSLADDMNFDALTAWRDKRYWRRRDTDRAAGGQPPLKHSFQNLFQMTLLGSLFLSALRGRYGVAPFDFIAGHEVIEIYPSCSVRATGHPYRKATPLDGMNNLLAHCAAFGIEIDVDPLVKDFCLQHNSGTAAEPDHDGADAFIAMCTAVMHHEGCSEIAINNEDLIGCEGAIYRPRRLGIDASKSRTRVI